MIIKFGTIFCLFIISKSFDIISISNSGKKEILFTKDKKYFVFEYKNSGGKHSEVKIIKTEQNNMILYIYIYLNKSDINEKLINYYRKGIFNESVYTVKINDLLREKFYAVISQPHEISKNNVTIKMYSSNDDIQIIDTNIFCKYFSYSSSKKYIFKFSPNIKGKYLKFGYFGYYQIYQKKDFSIYGNNQIIYYETKKLVNEGYFETKSDYSYSINLDFDSTDLYFYLILTDHLFILPVEIDTVYFQKFPSLSTLNLSLDTTSINNVYRFRVQFHYRSVASVKAYGYDTEDLNAIENNPGTQIDISNGYFGQTNTDKYFYIKKENSKLKRVILKITVPYPDIFEIRYGDQEYFYGDSFFASMLFGLSLSLPNLIVQIFRYAYKQRVAPWYSLIMNIILHLAYGNFLSYPMKIGGEISFALGYFFSALYFLCFIIFVCNFFWSKSKYIFNHLYNSCKEFEELPLLQESVDFNRKIPPKIIIKASSNHKESREVLKEYEPYQQAVYRNDIHVWQNGDISTIPHYDHTTINFEHVNSHYAEWKRVDEGGGKIKGKPGDSFNSFVKDVETRCIETWKDESEYKYISWQDNTKILSTKKEFPIIIANFDFNLSFNSSGEEGKKKEIDNLCKKGKIQDTDVYYREEYSCTGMINQRCYINKEEYNRIKAIHQKKNFIFEIIAFILGYSSIIDCFTFYEEGQDNFIIEKLISDENDCRAEYMKNDENLPEVDYSFDENKLKIEIENQTKFRKQENGNHISDSLLYE